MKRLFTLALATFVLCNQYALAQLGKGQVSLGGSIGAGTSNSTQKSPIFGTDESENKGFSIYPQLSVGVGGNWVIGLKPGLSINKGTSKNDGVTEHKSRSTGFEIEAFARKFFPFGERFGLFGQAEAGYGVNKSKNLMTGDKSESSGFDVALRPGAYFKAGKRFILESTIGSIGYGRTTNKPQTPTDTKSTSEGFGFSLSNGLIIGFHVIL